MNLTTKDVKNLSCLFCQMHEYGEKCSHWQQCIGRIEKMGYIVKDKKYGIKE